MCKSWAGRHCCPRVCTPSVSLPVQTSLLQEHEHTMHTPMRAHARAHTHTHAAALSQPHSTRQNLELPSSSSSATLTEDPTGRSVAWEALHLGSRRAVLKSLPSLAGTAPQRLCESRSQCVRNGGRGRFKRDRVAEAARETHR